MGRSVAHQKERRGIESEVRRRTVAVVDQLRRGGDSLDVAAQALRLPTRTIQKWAWQRKQQPVGPLVLRGRPLECSTIQSRRKVIALIQRQGSKIAAQRIIEKFPDLATRECADLLERYRRLELKAWRLSRRELLWPKAGVVWAADHASGPAKMAACGGRKILAVRDLSSGHQVLWRRVADETAQTTIDALESLFRADGAPLVLKLDNGPGFASEELREFLESWGVSLLPSPVRRPSYNGAIERSVGVLKALTENEAERHGRVGLWLDEDLRAARRWLNDRPALGCRRHTRLARWSSRDAITRIVRELFLRTVEERRVEALDEAGYARSEPLTRWAAGTIQRRSVTRALVAHGYLQYRSRRVPALLQRLVGAKMGCG